MKKLIFALICMLCLIPVYGVKYYVSPTGSDSNPGTLASPWLTWHYAFNNTTPSDTCYFRGGTYTGMYSTGNGVRLNTETRNGTHDAPTCYFAYPGEIPVLDCQSLTGTANRTGIEIAQASHLYIKGLTVKYVLQDTYSNQVRMFFISNNYNSPADEVNDITVENCVVHNGGGQGFHITNGCDTVRFINCDAYNLCDSLSTLYDYDPGGWGTGFGIYCANDDSYVTLTGCRAWDCSDQGFSSNVKGYIEWDRCWSIHNGYFQTNGGEANIRGSAWKSEIDLVAYKNTAILQVYMHNCLAVDNEMQGFNTNDGEGDPEFRAHFYNNFSYRNGHTHHDGTRWGGGYMDFARLPSDTVGLWDHIYVNCLSYNNWGLTPSITKTYPGDYIQAGSYNPLRTLTNYWDVNGTTVTDADFVSLDTTGLCGPRQIDGSLPSTNFGKLAPTSELIDAGTNVGISYYGSAPDVGYAEYIGEKILTKPGYIIFKNNKMVTHIER